LTFRQEDVSKNSVAARFSSEDTHVGLWVHMFYDCSAWMVHHWNKEKSDFSPIRLAEAQEGESGTSPPQP
jgi:hypothetical protein